MKINASLQQAMPITAEVVFRERMEPSIRQHLASIGVQSIDAVEQAVQTLRKIYISGSCDVRAEFSISPDDPRSKELAEKGECEEVNMFCQEMARVVISAQETQLISMATYLVTGLSDQPLLRTLH